MRLSEQEKVLGIKIVKCKCGTIYKSSDIARNQYHSLGICDKTMLQ